MHLDSEVSGGVIQHHVWFEDSTLLPTRCDVEESAASVSVETGSEVSAVWGHIFLLSIPPSLQGASVEQHYLHIREARLSHALQKRSVARSKEAVMGEAVEGNRKRDSSDKMLLDEYTDYRHGEGVTGRQNTSCSQEERSEVKGQRSLSDTSPPPVPTFPLSPSRQS
ncbi:hypothetical protein EYF80_018885 [Liparis tanakae]|uniref:Uncharacterized protein n=1 Tax=Liparis tanakae TaxID=230148 RepID=A0A4Z2HZD0_9TELE|nr:hypothetical protein EYF80_018885 [Liparis tanakae]